MNLPEESSANRYLADLQSLLQQIDPKVCQSIAEIIFETSKRGNTIFVCGNGGSASTASHMACDIAKNTSSPETPRPRILSLNDNVAHFSAIANDLDYSMVFVDQLRNLMLPGDLLIAISASGNSPNVVKAARFALETGCQVVGCTGFSGGDLRSLATASFHVACDQYGPVEDLHLVFNHILVITLQDLMKSDAEDSR